jgi:hypothetical protein
MMSCYDYDDDDDDELYILMMMMMMMSCYYDHDELLYHWVEGTWIRFKWMDPKRPKVGLVGS